MSQDREIFSKSFSLRSEGTINQVLGRIGRENKHPLDVWAHYLGISPAQMARELKLPLPRYHGLRDRPDLYPPEIDILNFARTHGIHPADMRVPGDPLPTQLIDALYHIAYEGTYSAQSCHLATQALDHEADLYSQFIESDTELVALLERIDGTWKQTDIKCTRRSPLSTDKTLYNIFQDAIEKPLNASPQADSALTRMEFYKITHMDRARESRVARDMFRSVMDYDEIRFRHVGAHLFGRERWDAVCVRVLDTLVRKGANDQQISEFTARLKRGDASVTALPEEQFTFPHPAFWEAENYNDLIDLFATKVRDYTKVFRRAQALADEQVEARQALDHIPAIEAMASGDWVLRLYDNKIYMQNKRTGREAMGDALNTPLYAARPAPPTGGHT